MTTKKSGSKKKARRSYSKKDNEKELKIFLVVVAVIVIVGWISANIIASIIIGIILAAIGGFIAWRKSSSLRRLVYKAADNFAPVKDKEIKELTDIIKGIKIQKVRNEEDFEKQLFQRLDAKDYKVERQVRYGSKTVIDLVVNERVGIELKIADRGKNIRDMVGQIALYRKHLKKIIVGILDCDSIPQSDLDEYISLIKILDEENIHVVLVKGNLKRHKKKQEYIMVKKTTF